MKYRLLTVYYSHSSNTKRLAQLICQRCGGDLLELVPEPPYPIDYRSVVNQARQEIEDGFRHPIKEPAYRPENYDVIAIGSPNWCGTAAPPVLTFLEQADLKGKRILPFCTHGGSGFSSMLYDMESVCKEAEFLNGFESYGGMAMASSVDRWLIENGILTGKNSHVFK